MNQFGTKRHIIIGDIHGCIVEFEKLLKKLQLRNDDTLYFIGDLIDKGPNSARVVKKAYELSKEFNTKLILGNHEEKFLRFLKNKKSNKGYIHSMSNIDEFEKLNEELTIEEKAFLFKAFFYLRVEKLNLFLVHGGIPENSILNTNQEIRFGERSGKELQKLRLITMTRMLNKEGSFLGLEQQEEGMYFWAENYDGKYGTVIFGHQPFIGSKVRCFPNAIGIDTGCVFGGVLSALIIDEHLKESVVQVPAEKKYCT
jgi:serine/threonine protein phosphatase 1